MTPNQSLLQTVLASISRLRSLAP